MAGALALAVIGLAVALASGGASTAPASSAPTTTTPGIFGGGGAFGSGGVVGIVRSVSKGGFTVNDRRGVVVTVHEQSTTTYFRGSVKATVSAVVAGARVLVDGSRSNDTVTATRVIVLPAGGFFGPGGRFGSQAGATGAGAASGL